MDKLSKIIIAAVYALRVSIAFNFFGSAIDELIQKNILYKLKNRGTYVMSPQKIQSGRSGLKDFTEAAKEYGNTSQTEVITFHAIDSVPTEIQEALKKNRCRYYL